MPHHYIAMPGYEQLGANRADALNKLESLKVGEIVRIVRDSQLEPKTEDNQESEEKKNNAIEQFPLFGAIRCVVEELIIYTIGKRMSYEKDSKLREGSNLEIADSFLEEFHGIIELRNDEEHFTELAKEIHKILMGIVISVRTCMGIKEIEKKDTLPTPPKTKKIIKRRKP